jgi:hypothetical protein
MQQSGQMTAHIAQPIHPAASSNATGLTPLLFSFSSITIACFGQKLTHKRQPLHLSLLMVILGMLLSFAPGLQQSTRNPEAANRAFRAG